jgi:co-chaperonin GroES (HSP10)
MIEGRNNLSEIDFDSSKSLCGNLETGTLTSFEASSVEMPKGYSPINDRILVQVVVEDKIGDIHVPTEASKERNIDYRFGRVLHLGDKVTLGLVPSDVIVFNYMGGQHFTLDGKDVFLLEESEVAGILQC